MIAPFFAFSRVRISYGDPIDLSAYWDHLKSHEILQEITDLLMSCLSKLGVQNATPADSVRQSLTIVTHVTSLSTDSST